MAFVFAVGSTFFLEIAKLRAARLAWAQVTTAFGVRIRRGPNASVGANRESEQERVRPVYESVARHDRGAVGLYWRVRQR